MVVIGWQYFVGYPQMEKQRQEAALTQQEQTRPGGRQWQPSPAQPPTLTREAAIAASPRIAIDTPRLRGSIDLKGGRIDDLSLQQYRETVDPDSQPIVLLSPSGAPDAYYAEFGWLPARGTSKLMPAPDTLWKQDGSGGPIQPNGSVVRPKASTLPPSNPPRADRSKPRTPAPGTC